MDINTEIRGYMARNMSREEFIKYVATAIEHQLKEWDGNYEVFLIKLKKYEFMINNGDNYYHVKISENELDSMQKNSPFDLDRKVWEELEKQGLSIIKGVGNYIERFYYINLIHMLSGCQKGAAHFYLKIFLFIADSDVELPEICFKEEST